MLRDAVRLLIALLCRVLIEPWRVIAFYYTAFDTLVTDRLANLLEKEKTGKETRRG